ncbi:DUF2637 domain-containing protein [Nocardia asteroides]|uniref:DUF2637 domain-containing protein n=1 Tax=Nocardia asteroides TaxID=1824 RepID=UPI001E286B04|nr:DUF2637 domain-containing protein [Nocardia asteroides]UGT54222.1 DUF2637 domain-containing protein [Nocardia asteroides]
MVIVLAIGAAAFVLSFAALRDLAIRARTPAHLAWLFPVIVDGTIIQATIAVLALADSAERTFFTRVLIAGATVSIGGNIAHALVSGHGLLAAILAVIAPAALLVDTHGLAVLLRTRKPAPPTEVPAAAVVAEPETAEDSAPAVVTAVSVPAPAVSPVHTIHSAPRSAAPLLPVAVPIPTGGN